VKYVPELWVNLFSIGKALAGGYKIGNKGMMLYLTKGSFKMTFDCLMATKEGYVMGIDMVPVAASVATAALERGVRVDINALYKMLSHVSKDATTTAAYYGWVLKGTWEDCADCGIVKAKQANLNKVPVDRSKARAERLDIDISSIKAVSYGQNKFWLAVLDDCTDHVWSFFIKKKKNDTVDKVLILIKHLKEKHDLRREY
jgi:hypothetical protein